MIGWILIVLLVWFCFATWRNSRTRRNLPPGPNPIFPFLGNIPQLAKYRDYRLYHMFDKLADQHGPLVYIQAGRLAQIIVQDLDVAKEVLNSDAFVDRLFDKLIAERSFGKPLGLIFNFGDGWKEMRKFTMKTLRDFGFGKQTSMESVLADEISTLMRTLDDSAVTGDDLSMRQFFTLTVLNILWSMVAGTRFSHDDARLKGLIQLVDDVSKNNPVKAEPLEVLPFFWRLQMYSAKLDRRRNLYRNMQQFLQEILDERRALGTYKDDPKDFFDVFLAEIDSRKHSSPSVNHYTDEQFMTVSYDLFAAGAETTSNTLEFGILYMILNPRVQQKVQEELDRVLGKHVRPTLADKSRLPYTEATLLEIQRHANVLPVTFRGAIQDTTVAGYHIPKGTLVGINNVTIHMNKKTWEDPEAFRPERFLDSSNSIVNAHKLLPFGLGKRVCLGESLARASLFSYFSCLLQRYSFVPSPNHPLPSTTSVYGFALSPQNYFVSVKHR